MSSTTVAEFASELKKSPDTLLEQLRSAGVAKSAPSDALSEADKQKLLGYLQASHGTATGERKKITLTKKSTTEIKQADASGKARTIQVEVRKKRTFVKRDDAAEAVPAQEPAAEAAPEPQTARLDEAELARREEEARRQAELIRRQEEDLAEKRRQREEAEQREREAQTRAAAERAAQASQNDGQDTAPTLPSQADQARAAAEAEARAQAEAASKASADDEAARAADLDARRRKALAEAEAIRAMMAAPAKKVLVAKKPEEIKPAVKTADGARPAAKGTLHKPAVGTGRPAPGSTPSGPGAGKEIKSAKLSSSWAGDPAKKKAIPTRGDSSGGVGRNSWRGGP